MKRYKIIENKAKCLKCGDIIESKYTHDYVQCRCGNISVDGGKDYLKRSYRDGLDTLLDMSISEEVVEENDTDAKTL